MHSGRRDEALALAQQARAAGARAGDRNAELFADMLVFHDVLQRAEYGEADLAFVREKIANSPAGMAYRCSYAWLLAERAETGAAREQLAIVAANGFAALHDDANRPSSLGELAAACRALGDRQTAAAVYALLLPYAGRPLTAGRAIESFGAADRQLGDLAALLGRWDAAVGHYEAAIRLNEEMGMRPWAVHARLGLAEALAGRGDADRARELRAEALDEAAALGLTGLLR
jgi:tetratricopeptide (TPR) repeat protein